MEALFITTIILFQIYFFYLTWKKIKILETIFEGAEKYKIISVILLQSDLETIAPLVLLRQLSVYQKRALENTDDQVIRLSLLNTYSQNGTSNTIIQSINTYLLRNSGAVSDFNLIRDIAERN